MYERKFNEVFAPIETERLIVRRFQPEDGADLSEILTDPKVIQFEPYELFTEEKACEEAKFYSQSDCFFAIELKHEKKVIGKLYFHDEGHFGTYEIGYTLHSDYHGLGYAKESAMALIRLAFESETARRIVANVDEANTRSWNLLEHMGFVREGELREYTYKVLDEDGQPLWQSMLIYAMLQSEFEQEEE